MARAHDNPPAAISSAGLVVGMEIHVELATRTRLFSRTPNIAHPDYYDAEPNSLIDPVNFGLPGALPVMNRAAVELAMLTGLALNCRIAPVTRWDRKNYFYPDLPKGYQISQYDLPLCFDGELEVAGDEGAFKVSIIRAHLEEDAGKLSHELPGGQPYDGTLIDFNRAGTPLLEIVSAPDMHSSQQAVAYAQEVRSLCRFLGVTEGDMQRGHMRFEPNINVVIVTEDGRRAQTPIVEVKNLNSFRSLAGAIEHEYQRQIEQWKTDGVVHGPGRKTTRGWDDVRQQTVLQRGKEDAHDYRYFPDPDLPPVHVDADWLNEVRARLPELPAARRNRYIEKHGLSAAEAAALTSERGIADYFEACIEADPSRRGGLLAKFLLNAAARRANEQQTTIDRLGARPGEIAAVLDLRERKVINARAADELLGLLCEPSKSVRDVAALARAHGLAAVRDEAALDLWVRQAIEAQPQAAADFAGGKDAALGRLVGEVMKRSSGQADAAAVSDILRTKLRK